MAYYDDYDYDYYSSFNKPKYQSVAERKNKAEEYVKKMAAKGIIFNPVVITGNKIAEKWWGLMWCKNLERYSDYANRLPRGKSYCKNGNVIDLKIEEGKIQALVMGTAKKPYVLEIDIDPVDQVKAVDISWQCSKKIHNVESLVKGEFPEDMEELFFQEDGLFPSPKEIHFFCMCPDSAKMCKHVASVLYAVGAKLDDDPLLFFKLRGIDINSLVKKAIDNRLENLLANAETITPRVYDDADIKELFQL